MKSLLSFMTLLPSKMKEIMWTQYHTKTISKMVDSENSCDFQPEEVYGDQPYPTLIIFTILLTAVFIIGVTGNVLTSITIIRTQFLRSTTNLFLCNLALSDTLLLIFGGAPFDI